MHTLPYRTAIHKLEKKLELLKQVSDVKNKPRFVYSWLFFEIRSLQRILHKNLGLKTYKVQSTQELKQADQQQRYVFADWATEKHENDPKKIILSNEANFTPR